MFCGSWPVKSAIMAAMQTRLLGHPEERERRRLQLTAPHAAPLADWVSGLRTPGRWVPDLDPADGGQAARALLLLESPGPAASVSGFVSVDNPGGTSENLLCLLHLAGLRRRDLAVWNAVPWQMSAGGVVAPRPAQYAEAAPLTRELLALLPGLRVVVLVGRHAAAAWPQVDSALPTLACPHPSPQNFRARPETALRALEVLGEVRRRLRGAPETEG